LCGSDHSILDRQRGNRMLWLKAPASRLHR
jgi:hypothetical protein